MSQRDLVAELRAAHVEAPPEVRERVRLIAAAAPAPPRRITWRRALVVAVPIAAAVAATFVITRPSSDRTTVVERSLGHLPGTVRGAPIPAAPGSDSAAKALAVPSPKNRVQTYDATLSLRVEHAGDVSDGVKRALRITTSFGGYSSSVHAETHGSRAVADLKLRIPRSRIQEAMAKLAQLGTITDENVSTVDQTALLNNTDREITRLQKQLAALRAQPKSDANARRIASLVTRIENLQRGAATTRRNAHYATVYLHLETPLVVLAKPHKHGPLHGVVVALKWLGIGAVYAVAIGAPVGVLLALSWLGVRVVRRRRENALLEI
ncbi:MAG TPA: DUF4349 domain-containing protein [Gaiellaceae bacterium]|nr:DUF4349 domain-containing protein [Gaiellaceae bacterium]